MPLMNIATCMDCGRRIFKESLNKSVGAPAGSFYVILRQLPFDAALLRLRGTFHI